MKKNAWALKYASDELKDDKEIFLAAVTQDGSALLHASDELKGDKVIVVAAVTQDGSALEYVHDVRLTYDRDVVRACGDRSPTRVKRQHWDVISLSDSTHPGLK